MASTVTSVTKVHAQTTVQPSPARQTRREPKAQPPAADTVQISSAARALQQRTEATAQTVQAAATGDVQAQAVLAKPAAHSFTQ
jgi:hypothetical protein